MKYIFQFVIGGTIIVLMNMFASYQPKLSAIIYSLPLQFTIAIIFIYLGQGDDTIKNISIYSIYSLIGVIFFILSFLLLTHYVSFRLSLAIAYVIFTASMIIILKYV